MLLSPTSQASSLDPTNRCLYRTAPAKDCVIPECLARAGVFDTLNADEAGRWVQIK